MTAIVSSPDVMRQCETTCIVLMKGMPVQDISSVSCNRIDSGSSETIWDFATVVVKLPYQA
eukprot:15443-Heterococcus_DN1.PRE.4